MAVHYVSMPKKKPAPPGRPPIKHKIFLREYRRANNLTQEAAAGEIGIDRSLLSKKERGISGYNQKLLEALAVVYHCTPADLIGRPPNTAWQQTEAATRAIAEALEASVKYFRPDLPSSAVEELKTAIATVIERPQLVPQRGTHPLPGVANKKVYRPKPQKPDRQ